KSFGRRVALVEDAVGGFANVRIVGMTIEPGAGESAVPRPVILGVGGGMNSDVSTTSLDVALEIVLLCGVQYVAGGVQEDDCAVACQIFRGESARVFSRVDREPILLPELPNSGTADSDGAVTESRRLGEHEYAGFLTACSDGYADGSEQKHERDESLHWRCSAMGDDQRAARQSAAPRSRWTEDAPSRQSRMAGER